MKPQAEAQGQRESTRQGNLSSPATADRGGLVPLTEEQKRVLHCLRESGSGLTFGMLQTRTGCSATSLEAALEGLVTSYLVTRLNTLVPSYAQRYSGIRVDTE